MPPPPGPLLRGSTTSSTFTMRTESPGEAHETVTSASDGAATSACASSAETVSTPSRHSVASPSPTPRT